MVNFESISFAKDLEKLLTALRDKEPLFPPKESCLVWRRGGKKDVDDDGTERL